jgi:uncharacterized membrane protein
VTDQDREGVDLGRRYAPERLIMLTDGVFAISMTLLALDVRIPDDAPSTAAGFNGHVSDLLVRLLVFVVAFLIAGRFWHINHRQLAYVRHVDGGAIQRTVLFLAGITSLPVATGVLFRYGDVPGAVAFAALVLAVTSALSARLWWYVSAPQRGLAEVDPDTRWRTMLRTVLVIGVYLLAVPVGYLLPSGWVSYTPVVWLLIGAVDPVVVRLHRRLKDAGRVS